MAVIKCNQYNSCEKKRMTQNVSKRKCDILAMIKDISDEKRIYKKQGSVNPCLMILIKVMDLFQNNS